MSPRYRRRRGNDIFGKIFGAFIFLSIFGGIFSDLLFDGIAIVVVLAIIALPIAAVVGLFMLIAKLIDSGARQNSRYNSRSTSSKKNTANFSTKDLLDKLDQYFAENEKLYIDTDLYIVKSGTQSLLTSYDIYFNDECISDLLLFANAYPAGFDKMADMIFDVITPKTTRKKNKTEVKVEQKVKEVKETVAPSKPQSYITSISKLNVQITDPELTESLDETVSYLQKIKGIEEEYPECTSKTTKLYEYYLPMLEDILTNYVKLSSKVVDEESFNANKERLQKTIILINGALKTISSTLMDDYYTDLKVDMKTLESVLKKDGLVDELGNSKEGLL